MSTPEATPQGQNPTPSNAPAASPAVAPLSNGAPAAADSSAPNDGQPAGEQQQSQQQTQQVAERPANVPEAYWNAEKGELNVEGVLAALKDADELKRSHDERVAKVPAKPEGYAIDLGELKLPDGFALNEADPLFSVGRELAHKFGLPQDEFSQFAQLIVGQQIEQHQSFQRRMAAEKDKLGAKAEERITAVTDALAARLGEKAKPFIHTLVSADMVEGFESLLNSSGQLPFAQNGRAQPRTDGKPEGFENLSAIDRRTWSLQQQSPAARR